MQIEDAKRKHEQALMATPGVVGVGIGLRDGRQVIKVFVTGPSHAAPPGVPPTLEGWEVDIDPIGTPRAE